MDDTDRGQVLRIVDWNVNGFHTITDEQLALLAEYQPDVLTLQEVLPSSFRRLGEAGYASGALARDLLGDPGRGKRRPRFSTGLFAHPPLEIEHACTLANVPSPKRTTIAHVGGTARPFELESLAIPPGVIWGDDKTVQGDRIADWWATRELPLLAGIDRNGPKFERIDHVEWWPRDSMRLLGDAAPHDLRDVYLDYLDQHPKRRTRIRDAQPAGPLATSYDRGSARPVPSRYDAIYASPEFSVLAAGYDWQRAIEAGSDHALVWTDLRLDG